MTTSLFSRIRSRPIFVLSIFTLLTLFSLAATTEVAQAADYDDEYDAEVEDTQTGKIPAIPGEQPWMVALVDAYERNAYDGQFCGGSLIAPDLVLTAAHCLEETADPDDVDIIVGRHVLSSNEGDRVNAEAIYLHDGYFDYSDGQDNDFAIIKLDRDVTAGTPIKLVGAANEYVDDPGTLARATGWGVLSELGEVGPDELHGVDLPIVSQAVCAASYGDDLLSDGLCAGYAEGGKDTCYGDSGGPLVARERDGTPVQVGVVSWGKGCGVADGYGIYARITEYETWIRDVRNGDIEPTDMSELVGFGDGDAWFDDEGDWPEEADDDGWWSDEEDADDEWWYEEDNELQDDSEAPVDLMLLSVPSRFELVYNDTFADEQSAFWDSTDGSGDMLELYTFVVADEATAGAAWFGGTDGEVMTVNDTEVLFENLYDEDGDTYTYAAYVQDGVWVEILGDVTHAEMLELLQSII